MSAEQLRAQIPASTDPERLEREARRIEDGELLALMRGVHNTTIEVCVAVLLPDLMQNEDMDRAIMAGRRIQEMRALKYAPSPVHAGGTAVSPPDRIVNGGLRESGEYIGVAG